MHEDISRAAAWMLIRVSGHHRGGFTEEQCNGCALENEGRAVAGV